MKALKTILITLVVIVVLLVLISFFLPSKVHVERTKVISAPPEVVFEWVNNYKNWEKWSYWHTLDPQMQLKYSDVTAGVGAWYEWSSKQKNVGNGKLEMLESVPNERIKNRMTFEGMGSSYSEIILEKAEGGTKVTMTMDNEQEGMSGFKKIMGKYFNLMMDKFVGKDYEACLNNMDSLAKAAPAMPAAAKTEYHIEEAELPAMKIISITDSSKVSELDGKFGPMYGELAGYAEKNKLNISGHAFAFYHKWPEGQGQDMMDGITVFEAGFPVAATGKSAGRIKSYETKSMKAVKVTYNGGYSGSMGAHMAISEYIKANNKQMNGSVVEIYVVGPGEEKDSTKWVTDIYYPVQ